MLMRINHGEVAVSPRIERRCVGELTFDPDQISPARNALTCRLRNTTHSYVPKSPPRSAPPRGPGGFNFLPSPGQDGFPSVPNGQARGSKPMLTYHFDMKDGVPIRGKSGLESTR